MGWRRIVAFLVFSFDWSWEFWVPKALAAEGLLEAVPALPELGAFGPTVAAFVLVTYEHRLVGVRRSVETTFDPEWVYEAQAEVASESVLTGQRQGPAQNRSTIATTCWRASYR